jgi:hypothetical protein
MFDKKLNDLGIQSDFMFFSLILFIISSFSSFVFLSIMDSIIENSLLHFEDRKIFSHSSVNLFKWNNELKMLSNFFSEKASNSWNQP